MILRYALILFPTLFLVIDRSAERQVERAGVGDTQQNYSVAAEATQTETEKKFQRDQTSLSREVARLKAAQDRREARNKIVDTNWKFWLLICCAIGIAAWDFSKEIRKSTP
jgi:hypothetical protein